MARGRSVSVVAWIAALGAAVGLAGVIALLAYRLGRAEVQTNAQEAAPAGSADERQSGTASVLRAERFELVDSAGRARATVEFSPDGEPVFALRSEAGDPRMFMALGHEGTAGLAILDPSGQKMLLHVGLDYETGLTLFDETGQPRAAVALYDNQYPHLTLADHTDTVRAELKLSRDGKPELSFCDDDGIARWSAPRAAP